MEAGARWLLVVQRWLSPGRDADEILIAAADRARLPVSTYVRTLILKDLAAPSRGGSTIHPSRSSAIPELSSLKRRISA